MRYYLYAALLGLFISSAWAESLKDMPKRKSGLWELSMKTDAAAAPMHMQQCVDEKSDDLMRQQGEKQGQAKCSKNTYTKVGNRIVSETVCQFGQTTATTKAVFTGDFTTAYRGEIHSSYSPPMHGMKESNQTLDAKWLGPCKPGQKPGDMVIPGMGTMNPAEMMKNMPKGVGGR